MGMKLNKKNYHTLKNKYLSNSKIKDFMKDPDYFYKKHVTGEIVFEPTPSMKIGSAVDLWLTGSPAQFRKKYQEKVLKKDNPDLFDVQKLLDPQCLLSPAEFAKVTGIVKRVKKLSIYKNIKKNFKSQKILKVEQEMGMFPGICGIPDWYIVADSDCIIVDLKTTQNVAENKFKWSCLDYGYYIQQAVYQMLLKELHPEIKKFKSYILAVESLEPYLVNLFELEQEQIDFTKVEVTRVLYDIAKFKAKDFKPRNISWKDSITI